MKFNCLGIFFGLLFLLAGCAMEQRTTEREILSQGPNKIIFDTDFGPDYDDVGALAMLHALMDVNQIELLAVMASNSHKLVGPSIDVVNTYYGRPDLPIGRPVLPAPDMGAFQHWPDS